MTSKITKEIKRKLEDAWLGIDYPESELFNPLEMIPWDNDDVHLNLAHLMMQPEYLPFVCKEILNLDVYPTQGLMLQYLWNHRFPMVVASRGFSKTMTNAIYCLLRALLIPDRKILIAGSVFRQSKMVFEYMEQIYKKAPMLRSICEMYAEKPIRKGTDMHRMWVANSQIMAVPIGCLSKDTLITTNNGITYLNKELGSQVYSDQQYRDIGFFHKNGVKKTKKIITKRGYEYTGTLNHKMKIVRSNKIVWCKTEDMKVGDYIVIDKSDKWFDNPTFNCTEDQAYTLGSMIGDGSYVRDDRLQFTTLDKESADRVSRGLWDYKIYDDLHYYFLGTQKVKQWKNFWGLDSNYAKTKYIPQNMMSSSKKNMAACLSGLFDTDGGFSSSYSKGGTQGVISYCSISKKLVYQMQYVLLHFGIISSVSSRNRSTENRACQTVYELRINGPDIQTFYNKIGFKLTKKQTQLKEYIENKKQNYPINSYIIPIEKDYIETILSHHKLGPKLSRSKLSSRKNITINTANNIINKSLQAGAKEEEIHDLIILANPNYYYDSIARIEDSGKMETFDIHVPYNNTYIANGFVSHNTGESIRGLRANDLIVEEFAAHDRDVFETVLAGFVAVSSDPVEKLRIAARIKKAEELGVSLGKEYDSIVPENQMLLSGTAYYQFNHFYEYWKKWCDIIESSDINNLSSSLAEEGKIDKDLRPEDFCVIRVPVDLIPDGFMDKTQIARAKASLHSGNFDCEYGAIFSADSAGFFKRSLIESCVCSKKNKVMSGGMQVEYYPSLKGEKGKKYVIGVDPASEQDNFAVIVVEVGEHSRKIVYCWTINRKEQKKRVADGLIDDNDFYYYCAIKLRELMESFEVERIALDSQGGGFAVLEALGRTVGTEKPIYEVRDPTKFKETDVMPGLHIVEMINFAKYDWTSNANHNMRKDFEHKQLLFPAFDSLSLGFAEEVDKHAKRRYDTMEDCILELEELKNELTSIIITSTATGKERWDTPDTKVSGTIKRRMRKDRYSALLMANAVARDLVGLQLPEREATLGGFATNITKEEYGPDFIGPDYLTAKYRGLY